MKYWMPGAIALLAMPAVHAANYRLVYSPSQKLEVFIDDVKNNKPESWCAKSIPLRIVSGQSKDAAVLDDFLPRVGNLLEKQCPSVAQLPWQLTDKGGQTLAEGNAAKNQRWKPLLKQPPATPPAQPSAPPAVTVTSPLADAEPVQTFDLPQGCRFRTYWSSAGNGSALFIPGGDNLRCADGWLNGSSTVLLQQSKQAQPVAVTFLQGYPLINLNLNQQTLRVVSANRQRLVLGGAAAGSYLLLPFDTQRHAWAYGGTIIVELPRLEAADAAKVKQRIGRAHEAWQPLLAGQPQPTFKLVESLAADREDPASGSYQTVTATAH
ncbi:type VI secretion system-associated protein [Gibbsiella quercinecans]|uniref:type VI secretion system-associated protein n=1 Tax=Gibbsiella quercinecans TaxID=929813 RepID=UPI003A4D2B76